MATTVRASDLRNLDDDAIEEKLRESKEELFNLRFQAATGQLESHGRLRQVRREIARLYTIVRERELGITSVARDETNSDETNSDETSSDKTSSDKKTEGEAPHE